MQNHTIAQVDPRIKAASQFILDVRFNSELEEMRVAHNCQSGGKMVDALHDVANVLVRHFDAEAKELHLAQCLGQKANLGDVPVGPDMFDVIESLHCYLDFLILAHMLPALHKRDLGVHNDEMFYQLRTFAIDSYVNVINHVKEEEADRGEITPDLDFVRLMLTCKDAIIGSIDNATSNAGT